MHRPRPHDALLALGRAQLAGVAVRLRFRDTERRSAERTVEVVALSFDPPRWVAAAWSPELGSLRVLDVARVLSVRPTRRRAGPAPAGFAPAFFALRAFFRGPGPPSAVTVRL